jgi:hypothetical protein
MAPAEVADVAVEIAEYQQEKFLRLRDKLLPLRAM